MGGRLRRQERVISKEPEMGRCKAGYGTREKASVATSGGLTGDSDAPALKGATRSRPGRGVSILF